MRTSARRIWPCHGPPPWTSSPSTICPLPQTLCGIRRKVLGQPGPAIDVDAEVAALQHPSTLFHRCGWRTPSMTNGGSPLASDPGRRSHTPGRSRPARWRSQCPRSRWPASSSRRPPAVTAGWPRAGSGRCRTCAHAAARPVYRRTRVVHLAELQGSVGASGYIVSHDARRIPGEREYAMTISSRTIPRRATRHTAVASVQRQPAERRFFQALRRGRTLMAPRSRTDGGEIFYGQHRGNDRNVQR